MFAMPSMWGLLISTIVFFVAAWYARRYLDEQEIPKGMMRNLLIFMAASLASYGAGAVVDWTQEKVAGPQPAAQTPDDLSELLNAVSQVQP